MTEPIKNLYCSCCGAITRGRQFWNQDTGHGICPSCAKFIESRNRSDENLEQSHGKRGYNYDLKETGE